jgi:hypothetical protein
VSQKSWCGFARLYLGNPWDYRNGMGTKRCVSSLSFVWFEKIKNVKYHFCSKLWPIYEKIIWPIFALSHLLDSSWSKFARSYHANPWDYGNGTGDKRCVGFSSFVKKKKKMITCIFQWVMADIQKNCVSNGFNEFYRNFLFCAIFHFQIMEMIFLCLSLSFSCRSLSPLSLGLSLSLFLSLSRA